MSTLPPRRSALSRADLVAALAALDGAPPDATALTIADALGLEWQPPKIQPRKRRTQKIQPETVLVNHEWQVNQAPLLETRFWQVVQAEFFSEPEKPEPPPDVAVFKKWHNPPQAPPRFQPLSTWAELAPRLRKVLSRYHEGRAIDLNQTISQISRGHLLERFPHERRRRWGPTLLLIEDDSHWLMPFREDKRRVRSAIQTLLPRHSLIRALMHEHLKQPELLGQDDANWPPPPGTLVLALSDLGCLSVTGKNTRQHWLDMGRELQEAGCHPIALFPGPLARCSQELATLWQLVPWERPRPHDGVSSEQRAERLLRLLAPAVRVTPGLLRAVRLLLPEAQADAGTEADVWQHPDFNSHLVAPALVLERAQALRQALAAEPGTAALHLRARLIRCLKEFRYDLPQEIWFDELLNFDPGALKHAGMAEDREDAQAYFASFCAENPDLTQLAMPGCDRAWLLRVKARAPELFWRDQKVGKRLAQLALAIDPEGTPPAGIGARDMPFGDQLERNVYLLQRGAHLAVSEDVAAAQGSALAVVPSRNGWVEITPDNLEDDPNAFWAAGQPPDWASAWGWDDYGAWVAFAVDQGSGQVTQNMRWIGPGSFLMGSPETEAERLDREGPQHPVTFTQGFWLFDTACTQALWQAVMGNNPSHFKGDGRLPVENVSWHDAQAFIEALNQKLPGLQLALPSEAQWEYACRAGTKTPFAFGDTITPVQVNYDGNYPYADGIEGEFREKTVPVASLPTNSWGLYEMHGNVDEWVQDTWHDSYQGAPNDGKAWLGSNREGPRVVRGGSWDDDARYCRCAFRSHFDPDDRYDYLGFRCARV